MTIRILPEAEDWIHQLPQPVNGVITIPDNYSYFFSSTLDLEGNRLVCGQNVSLIGSGSENAILKSTGLVGLPLISSNYSLPMQQLTITADIALDLDGQNTARHEWLGVNFSDCNNVGTIKNCSTILMDKCQFTNSKNLIFDGTHRAIAFDQCGFTASAGGTSVKILSTAVIVRRIRFVYCAFAVNAGCTGIDASVSTSIPSEGYILDGVSFMGAGTYLAGIQNIDNKALFQNVRGVSNSSYIGHLYMVNNLTATTLTTANTFYKIAGTTTAGPLIERFTHANNRLTYTGSLSGFFQISGVAAVKTANNVSFSLRAAKNGVTSSAGEATIRQESNTAYSSVTIQDVFSLSNGDYIEIFAAATNANQAFVTQDLNVLIKRLN